MSGFMHCDSGRQESKQECFILLPCIYKICYALMLSLLHVMWLYIVTKLSVDLLQQETHQEGSRRASLLHAEHNCRVIMQHRALGLTR